MTVVPTPTHVLTRRVANRNRPQLEDGAGHRAHMGRSSEEARRLSLRSLPNHGWDRRPSNDCPSMTLAINGTVATWVAARLLHDCQSTEDNAARLESRSGSP